MSKSKIWCLKDGIMLVIATIFILFLHDTIPFVSVPTLGQAVWTSGFAQSFANGPWYNIFAHDFGIPQPAAIAFGFSGAWLESLFIRIGLHSSDAYSCMVTFWLMVAFFAAIKISEMFGAYRSLAICSGLVWMSMPIIWGHAGYSMLSLGIALLSFYFLSFLKLIKVADGSDNKILLPATIYLISAIVSIFMDGYTFMMFATGASILFAFIFVCSPKIRKNLLCIILPIHMVSFFSAYLLFCLYIGRSSFESHSIDFFRGWGLDLSFIAISTKGMLWLPDLLGLSTPRTDSVYFGDSSVWTTTFSLPVILTGLVAWWLGRKKNKLATGLLFVAVLGFYMALGPSLKISSMKPAQMQMNLPGQKSAVMPAEFAVAPTGNAWISENLPGFNVMRASYRWSALGVFAFWMLIIFWIARINKKHQPIDLIVLFVLFLLNLPNLSNQWHDGITNRKMFHQIDDDLASELQKKIKNHERVVFIPWGNDFIVNYLSSIGGFRTFNVGGDKNLAEAKKYWPTDMQLFDDGVLNEKKIPALVKLLVSDPVDVIVIPYFNMLWSAHLWPCKSDAIPDFLCPSQQKSDLEPTIHSLAALPYLEVVNTNLFATIRLSDEFTGSEGRARLLGLLLNQNDYPIVIEPSIKEGIFLFEQGWYNLEENHVWSQSQSKLRLPVPGECASRHCEAVLKFTVFGAYPTRPVMVHFSSADWSQSLSLSSGDLNEIAIPLNSTNRNQEIKISVPEAISPEKLMEVSDNRILGIALQRIELDIQ
ncbi:Uncharacterised protein [Serratia quinivorans]|uniref:hypothetical protein n=1 Tax=Serratia quinivorans TaxID=137545 RepID=UPI00217C993B|nr:hypothetical protein [Serratia quinivorans]CAI1813216.1 Uncharacterised protein [Serratia quinivorans]